MGSYREHSNKRAVFMVLQRLLLDKFINDESDDKEKIINESVPRNESIVDQDTLKACYADLQVIEHHHNVMMARFSWKETDATAGDGPLSFLKDDEAKADGSEEKPPQKRKRRKKSEPEPEGNVQ